MLSIHNVTLLLFVAIGQPLAASRIEYELAINGASFDTLAAEESLASPQHANSSSGVQTVGTFLRNISRSEGADRVVEILSSQLQSEDLEVRKAAIFAVAKLGTAASRLAGDVAMALVDSDKYMRGRAEHIFGTLNFGWWTDLGPSEEDRSFKDIALRQVLAHALPSIASEKFLSNSDVKIRRRALEALAFLQTWLKTAGKPGYLSIFSGQLIPMMADSDEKVRRRAREIMTALVEEGSLNSDVHRLMREHGQSAFAVLQGKSGQNNAFAVDSLQAALAKHGLTW